VTTAPAPYTPTPDSGDVPRIAEDLRNIEASKPVNPPAPFTFQEALTLFVNHADALAKVAGRAVDIQVDDGDTGAGKFVRVYEHDPRRPGDERSAFCFVCRDDGDNRTLGAWKRGDVLKAAGWKCPAKGTRGNIMSGDPAAYGIDAYGAKSNRPGY
jgi:hypothetical protein